MKRQGRGFSLTPRVLYYAASLVYIKDPEYSSEVINTKTTASKSCVMS